MAKKDDETPSRDDGLWVTSEVTPTGAYRTTISVNGRKWPLGYDQAIAYAVACIARATEAEHDAALWALCLKKLELEEEAIGQLVFDARETRGIDHSATEPIRYVPGVSVWTREPFLSMELDGKAVGQLSPRALRGHAHGVFSNLASLKLDESLVKTVMESIGAPENTARGMVSELIDYWPGRNDE